MSNKHNMCVWQRIEFTVINMNIKKRKETEIHETESRKKLNSSISPASKRKNLNRFIDWYLSFIVIVLQFSWRNEKKKNNSKII